MNPKAITQAEFEEVTRDGIVLIDWWASWCGPCRAFAPVYESVAARHPDIVFAKVDTEAEPELSEAFGIHAIPTLMAFRAGILVYSSPGAMTAGGLEQLLARVRALDMDAVRREIAARETAGARGQARTQSAAPR
jgi:thioredoxin 1